MVAGTFLVITTVNITARAIQDITAGNAFDSKRYGAIVAGSAVETGVLLKTGSVSLAAGAGGMAEESVYQVIDGDPGINLGEIMRKGAENATFSFVGGKLIGNKSRGILTKDGSGALINTAKTYISGSQPTEKFLVNFGEGLYKRNKDNIFNSIQDLQRKITNFGNAVQYLNMQSYSKRKDSGSRTRRVLIQHAW